MKTILFFVMALALIVGISLEGGGGGRDITRDRQLSNVPVCENAGIAPMIATTSGEGGGTRRGCFHIVFDGGGGDLALMSFEGGGGFRLVKPC